MSYRNKQNELIDFATWQGLRASEEIFSSVVNYGEYQISINRKYFGTEGSVFKVWVECSSDLAQFHGYKKHYEGETESSLDFDRIVLAVQQDEEIFDKSREDGLIQLIYDVRYDQHIVCDLRQVPEIDYCFATRSEAETKYNELIGG